MKKCGQNISLHWTYVEKIFNCKIEKVGQSTVLRVTASLYSIGNLEES